MLAVMGGMYCCIGKVQAMGNEGDLHGCVLQHWLENDYCGLDFVESCGIDGDDTAGRAGPAMGP